MPGVSVHKMQEVFRPFKIVVFLFGVFFLRLVDIFDGLTLPCRQDKNIEHLDEKQEKCTAINFITIIVTFVPDSHVYARTSASRVHQVEILPFLCRDITTMSYMMRPSN